MASALAAEPRSRFQTVADLLDELGGIPADRVRMRPWPGSATEADVLEVHDRQGRLCELVRGVLVEKPMGFPESILSGDLFFHLKRWIKDRDLGLLTLPDGMIRLAPDLIRIPDLAFFSWDRLPGRRKPTRPVPEIAPDLVVEVLSPGNTKAEMDRKVREYFEAGVRLVWLVDPRTRTVTVHEGPDRAAVVERDGVLSGGAVLPGFESPLAEVLED